MEFLSIERIKKDFVNLASLDEVCLKYNVTEKYIKEFVENAMGQKVEDVIKCYHTITKIKIRELVISTALEGNVTMLSFLAKNYLPENKPTQLSIFNMIHDDTKKDLSQFKDLQGLNNE